jgi:putative ABC transport system substrate-binding protein
MMDRRTFVAALAGGLLVASPAAEGQPAGNLYRIGFLGIPSRGEVEHLVQPFEQALRQRGWVTGKNLVIEYRWAEGKYDRLPAFAAELVRLEPQVIVAPVTAAAQAAKGATSIIPIVMVTVSDPLGDGLIASLARPGGNVTGLTLTSTSEIWAKQLQLLGEVVPHAKRVAFLWNPANMAATRGVRTVEEAARALGVELQVAGVRAPEEFEPAFRAMTQARAHAVLVLADAMFLAHRARLADLALEHRLPTLLATKEYVKAGGLVSYGADYPDLFRRAAIYVEKILKGATPADLPVEQPTKFELVINLKTAKALGLTIPPSLLQRADQIIE